MHVKDRGYTSKLVSIIFRRGVVIIRKRFEYIVIVVIIFTIFGLVFFKNNIKENKMIIIVDGWNMEYFLSDRKLVFENDVTNENLEAMYLYKKQEEIVLKKK